jgi:hypothetical protein
MLAEICIWFLSLAEFEEIDMKNREIEDEDLDLRTPEPHQEDIKETRVYAGFGYKLGKTSC